MIIGGSLCAAIVVTYTGDPIVCDGKTRCQWRMSWSAVKNGFVFVYTMGANHPFQVISVTLLGPISS